jgi:hypothetical protein
VLYVAPRGRRILSFPATIRHEEGAMSAALGCLRHLPKASRRGLLVIEKIDGIAADQSPLLERFRGAGYALDYRGLIDLLPPGGAAPARR